MALDTDAFKSEVREGVGRVSLSEFSDVLLTTVVTRALKEFSQYCPDLAETTLALVDGTTIYTAPSGTLAILSDSWRTPGTAGTQNTFERSLGQVSTPLVSGGRSGSQTALDTFLSTVEYERLAEDQERHITLHGNKLLLTPTPTEAETLRLMIAVAWTTASFPVDQYREELLLCAKWMAAEELLVLRSKFSAVVVGRTNIRMDNADLRKQMEVWKKEFKTRADSFPIPLAPGY